MESPQISETNLLKKFHDEMLHAIFNFIIKDVYEQLLKNETSTNVHYSDICQYSLKIIEDYPQEKLQNVISIKHYNYRDLNLIKTNLKNCENLNVLNIAKYISPQLKEVNTPFVLLKINALLLEEYLGDDVEIDNLYDTMQLNVKLNETHKIKVCKYKNKTDYHIIIFFDSLNYNNSYAFVNHDVIENLNEYNDVLSIQFSESNSEYNSMYTFASTQSIQIIKKKYIDEFTKILNATNPDEIIVENVNKLITDIISTKEARERIFFNVNSR